MVELKLVFETKQEIAGHTNTLCW